MCRQHPKGATTVFRCIQEYSGELVLELYTQVFWSEDLRNVITISWWILYETLLQFYLWQGCAGKMIGYLLSVCKQQVAEEFM